MKVFASLMAAAVVCASMAGCNRPDSDDDHRPMITVSANHRSIRTTETTEVRAVTVNLVGASGVQWQVNPSTATLTPDANNALVAIFAANEPGTYVIRATAQLGTGEVIRSNIENVTVSGPPRGDRVGPGPGAPGGPVVPPANR